MTDTDKTLRKELLEARAKVERQIDILQTGRSYRARTLQVDELTSRLMAILAEIDNSLAELSNG